MDKNFYAKAQNMSLQFFFLVLMLIILEDILNFSIGNLSIGLLSIVVGFTYSVSTYHSLDKKKTQHTILFLFIVSGLTIILSNFFFFDILSKYHFFL